MRCDEYFLIISLVSAQKKKRQNIARISTLYCSNILVSNGFTSTRILEPESLLFFEILHADPF